MIALADAIQSPGNSLNICCRLGTLKPKLDFHIITNWLFFSFHKLISVLWAVLLENSLKEALIAYNQESDDLIRVTCGFSLRIYNTMSDW